MSKQISQLAAAVHEARHRLLSHDSRVEAESARLSEFRAKASAARTQFETVAEQVASRNLAATLADLPLPDECPKQASELRRLQATIRATEDAIPHIQQAVAALKASRPELRRAVSMAFWPWKRSMLEDTLDQIQGSFAQAEQAIADLTALDQVQDHMLGTDFVTDTSVERTVLVSSSRLMERLIEGIPKRCRPSALEPNAIRKAAQASAAQLIQSLEA